MGLFRMTSCTVYSGVTWGCKMYISAHSHWLGILSTTLQAVRSRSTKATTYNHRDAETMTPAAATLPVASNCCARAGACLSGAITTAAP